MSAQEIRDLAHGMLAAKRIFDEATAPFVKDWLELAVKKQHLTPQEAARHFQFDDFGYLKASGDCLIFESEDWEETWQYGGYEKHYGRSITIPLEFFDDPEPFRVEADREVEARLAFKNRRETRDKQQRIKDLEAQLAKARKEG